MGTIYGETFIRTLKILRKEIPKKMTYKLLLDFYYAMLSSFGNSVRARLKKWSGIIIEYKQYDDIWKFLLKDVVLKTIAQPISETLRLNNLTVTVSKINEGDYSLGTSQFKEKN